MPGVRARRPVHRWRRLKRGQQPGPPDVVMLKWTEDDFKEYAEDHDYMGPSGSGRGAENNPTERQDRRFSGAAGAKRSTAVSVCGSAP